MARLNYEGTHPVRCGACGEAFNFVIKLEDVDTETDIFASMDCRHCGVALSIDLKPYLTPLAIYKSAFGDGPMTLDLPGELAGKS